ncbi:MAG: hypothetical protein IH942_09220 [Acidobacteria bacterium]|nr:hypothetical protein [Acidobacteriota bacterium]
MSTRTDVLTVVGLVVGASSLAVGLVALTSFAWWADLVIAVAIGVALLIVLRFIPGGKEKPPSEPERGPLFSLRLPEAPTTGHIDNYKTVVFGKVLVTKHAEGVRALRFGLAMPEREFLDFGDFQEIWQETPEIHSRYISNPVDLPTNRQGMLAFVHAPGSSGVADSYELSVYDTGTRQTFKVSGLGEYTFYDDGTVEQVDRGHLA